MLKRSFLAIPLVAMLSMSLLTACGDKKEAAAPAKEEKVLRVGTNPTFAPFEFQAKGSNDLTGFDIDLAKALGKQMGYKVELVNLGFDGLIPALSTGNIDLAVSGMSITEERKNAVDFCDPYYTSGLIVLVRPDETNIKSINDLVGKRIGAQIGTQAPRRQALSKVLMSNSTTTPMNRSSSSTTRALMLSSMTSLSLLIISSTAAKARWSVTSWKLSTTVSPLKKETKRL